MSFQSARQLVPSAWRRSRIKACVSALPMSLRQVGFGQAVGTEIPGLGSQRGNAFELLVAFVAQGPEGLVRRKGFEQQGAAGTRCADDEDRRSNLNFLRFFFGAFLPRPAAVPPRDWTSGCCLRSGRCWHRQGFGKIRQVCPASVRSGCVALPAAWRPLHAPSSGCAIHGAGHPSIFSEF